MDPRIYRVIVTDYEALAKEQRGDELQHAAKVRFEGGATNSCALACFHLLFNVRLQELLDCVVEDTRVVGEADGDVRLGGEIVKEAETVGEVVLRIGRVVQFRGIAVLVLKKSREVLGCDLCHNSDLLAQRGALEDSDLVSKGDGEFWGQVWIFEGCIAN